MNLRKWLALGVLSVSSAVASSSHAQEFLIASRILGGSDCGCSGGQVEEGYYGETEYPADDYQVGCGSGNCGPIDNAKGLWANFCSPVRNAFCGDVSCAPVRDVGVCGTYRPLADVCNGLNACGQPLRDLRHGSRCMLTPGCNECGCGSCGYTAKKLARINTDRSGCGLGCGGSIYWPRPLSACFDNCGGCNTGCSNLGCEPGRPRLFTSGCYTRPFGFLENAKMLPSLRCDDPYNGCQNGLTTVTPPCYEATPYDGEKPITEQPYFPPVEVPATPNAPAAAPGLEPVPEQNAAPAPGDKAAGILGFPFRNASSRRTFPNL